MNFGRALGFIVAAGILGQIGGGMIGYLVGYLFPDAIHYAWPDFTRPEIGASIGSYNGGPVGVAAGAILVIRQIKREIKLAERECPDLTLNSA